MADSIVKLRVDSAEYDNKLKRAAEGIQHLAAKIHDSQGEFVGLDNEQKEFIKNLQYMNTVSHTAAGKVRELETAYKGLQTMYNGFTAFEKNSEEGKILAEQLSILREKTIQARSEMENANRSISNTGGFLDQLKSKFTVNIDALSLFDKGLAAAKGALDVAKDAFFQSESNIDEWGRTLEGAEGAYNVFLDTLNNGNWRNFFENLETAIQGGRDLYDALDRLGSIKSNNAAAIALVQQQIAQLRLAKQQGKDVDDQLKAATARLAALQKQSIQAGKAAGNQTAFNVIRNGVNSIGGARVNDATIRLAVDQLMTGGQAQFDKFRNNRDILRQRGMVTRTQTITDSQGGTYQRQYKVFDINALTREQQKQYAIAQAITEGETRIQTGIDAFAQAVSEGTASAREEFKGNRYALQGSRGGGGTGGGGGTTITTPIQVKIEGFDPLKAAAAGVQGVDTMPSVHGMADRDALRAAMGIAPRQWDAKQDVSKDWHVGQDGQLTQDPSSKRKESKKDRTQEQADKTVVGEMGKLTSGVQGIFSGIEQMGITVPDEIKGVINGIQGVMTILTSINTILGVIEGLQAVGLIPFMARGGVVPHAATGMVIPGHDYSDSTLIAASSGEIIMNKAQQGSLINQLEGAQRPVHVTGELDGEKIILVVNRTFRRKGQGEIVTW